MGNNNTGKEEIKKSQNIKSEVLPSDELAVFCTQVYLILEAGIPLYDGFNTLADEAENKETKEIYSNMSKILLESGSLYLAIKDVHIFPEYMINMINIGEETGKLDDVLKSLNLYYEREANIKKAVKSAITYPIVLICMMSAVAILIVTRILPVFQDIFKSLGSDMTDTGRTVMNTAAVLGYVVFGVTVAILVIVIVFAILSKLGYKNKILKILGAVPTIKKMNLKISASRFSAVISMMLSSGYSLEEALELAPSIIEDSYTKEKVSKCQNLIKEGKSFVETLEETGIFDGLTNRMIGIGYKAGKLDSVMKKISDKYEEEVSDSIGNIVSIIEPTLVAIMSVIIGGILISVMLPLANIMSSIG